MKISNVSLFERLDEYALQLNRKRREVEERTLFVADQRVVTQGQINYALAEYQELKNLADELRENLRQEYQTGATEFRYRMRDLLSTPEFRIPEAEQQLKVAEICHSFLSFDEIDNLLRVELKIYKIPSLEQQMQEQTRLKRELTRLKQAERQEQAESALTKAQEEDLERSRQLREGIFSKAKAEIESIVAAQIEAITKYEPETPSTNSQKKLEAHFKRNEKIRAKLAAHLRRMKVLTEIGFDNSVSNTVTQLENLSATMNSPQRSNLEETLSNLQQELQNSLSQIEKVESPVLEESPILL